MGLDRDSNLKMLDRRYFWSGGGRRISSARQGDVTIATGLLDLRIGVFIRLDRRHSTVLPTYNQYTTPPLLKEENKIQNFSMYK